MNKFIILRSWINQRIHYLRYFLWSLSLWMFITASPVPTWPTALTVSVRPLKVFEAFLLWHAFRSEQLLIGHAVWPNRHHMHQKFTSAQKPSGLTELNQPYTCTQYFTQDSQRAARWEKLCHVSLVNRFLCGVLISTQRNSNLMNASWTAPRFVRICLELSTWA